VLRHEFVNAVLQGHSSLGRLLALGRLVKPASRIFWLRVGGSCSSHQPRQPFSAHPSWVRQPGAG
jgi:hypothetical protein